MPVEKWVLAPNAQALVQLEDASVANGRAIDDLRVVLGHIGLQECHPVYACAAEHCGRPIHAQGARGRRSEPVRAHIVALVVCRDLFYNKPVRQLALLREVLCYVSFDPDSVDPWAELLPCQGQ